MTFTRMTLNWETLTFRESSDIQKNNQLLWEESLVPKRHFYLDGTPILSLSQALDPEVVHAH